MHFLENVSNTSLLLEMAVLSICENVGHRSFFDWDTEGVAKSAHVFGNSLTNEVAVS